MAATSIEVTFDINTYTAHNRPSPSTGVVTAIRIATRAAPVACGFVIPEFADTLTTSLPADSAERVCQYAEARVGPGKSEAKRNCITFALVAAGLMPPDFKDQETTFLRTCRCLTQKAVDCLTKPSTITLYRAMHMALLIPKQGFGML